MSSPYDVVTERSLARVGRTLRDKWRLDRLLGVGGMAAVYAATHRNGSRGAIKMLHVELSLEPEIRARFLREGYVANSVGHDGVVRVIDDDVAEDGAVFLVMELLSGETLDARWERKGKKLSPIELFPVIDELLGILEAAHAKAIIHRDIKPENVFLNHDGSVKLLDFGIARLRDVHGATATRSGAALGTPAYMPPEQALGSSSEIGPETDVWAVGASMFQLLSGHTVHEADSPNAQLVKAATVHARSLADVAKDLPPGVVSVVDRALAYDKADRWRSAGAMQSVLRAVYEELTGESVERAPPLSVPAPRESAAIQIMVSRPRSVTTGGASASGRTVAVSRPPVARRGHGGAVVVGVMTVSLCLLIVGYAIRRRDASPPPAPVAVVASSPAVAASVKPPEPAPSAPSPVVDPPPPVIDPPSPPAASSSAHLLVVARGGVCDVLVDDVPVGKTPLDDVSVAPGEHRISCKLPSGGTVSRTVRVKALEHLRVPFALAPSDPMDQRR